MGRIGQQTIESAIADHKKINANNLFLSKKDDFFLLDLACLTGDNER